MKKFGSLFKKNIVKILILIIIVQFSIQPASQASVGGVLFTPIQDLVMALGDVGENVLRMIAYGDSTYAKNILKLTRWSNKTVGDSLEDEGIFAFVPRVFITTIQVHVGIWLTRQIHKTFSDKDFAEFIELPIMSITPDKIFSNDIPLLNVNIINPTEQVKDDKENTQESVVYTLQSTISTWYVVLRNIAIVAMLSVLVYIGIKIVLSSAAEDKAKYKEMIKDWVIGLCLIFLMHYGMSFMLEFNNAIIRLLSKNNQDVILVNDKLDFTEFTKDMSDDQTKAVQMYNVDDSGNYVSDKLNWHTDLAGELRFLAQTNIKSNTAFVRFGYTVMYFVLVIYTWMFFIKYLVRVLHIIFLTLIAPVVALAYPIDKVGDGSAQTFNSWVKEYIFTLLMQPMHMILYTILISSAMQLAVDHPIYGIIVFGVMLQLEKMVKKIFGFDRAPLGRGEAGSFAGAFTGSTVMHGLDRALHNIGGHKLPPPPGGGPKKGGQGGNVRFADNRTKDAGVGDVIDSALGGVKDSQDNSKTEDLPIGSVGDNSGSAGTLPSSTNSATQEYADYNIGNGNGNPDLSSAEQDYLDWNMGNGLPSGNNEPIRTQNVEQFADTQSGNNNNSETSQNPNLPSADSGEFDTIPQIRTANNKGTPQTIEAQRSSQNTENTRGNQQINQNNTENKKKIKSKPKKQSSIGGAVWRAYAKPILKKAGKVGIRMAGAATLGAAGATMGIAAGLATDDMTNVAKYGAALGVGGAVAGNNIAKNTVNGIPRAAKGISNAASKAHDNYRRERDTPEEYQKYQNKKADNEFRKNKEVQEKFEKEFGRKQAKEKMEDAMEYRKNGVTDTDLIIRTMKLDSGVIGKTESTSKERIAAAKLASGVSSAKDINSMQSRLEEKGYDKKLVEQNMEAVRKLRGLENN